MSVSYNRLWKLLIDKNMSVADMRRAADIAPNTVTRMKKDQEVTLAVLEKMCVHDIPYIGVFADPSAKYAQTGISNTDYTITTGK